MNASKAIAAGIVALGALLFATCSIGPAYPTGKATVIGTYEQDYAGERSLVIQYRVDNTGTTVIESGTVSFKVGTDAREYYASSSKAYRILPGHEVYATAGVTYRVATETATAVPAAEVVDEFYE